MSSVAMDEFYPMPEGPGADVMFDRWRHMAQLWAPPGVVRGVGSQLAAIGWTWTEPDPAVAIADGAVWLGGAFAEILAPKWIAVPGNVGLVLARMDPLAQRVELVFKEGPGHTHVEDSAGWWEVPIVRLNGPGDWVDVRPFTPLEIPPPPVTEMPASTPWGRIASNVWPPTQTDFPGGGERYAWPVNTAQDFVPGRNYRLTMGFWRQGITQVGGGSTAWASNMTVGFRDDAGIRHSMMYFQSALFNNDAVRGGQITFAVTPAYANATLYLITDTTGILRFAPWVVTMDCYDIGG